MRTSTQRTFIELLESRTLMAANPFASIIAHPMSHIAKYSLTGPVGYTPTQIKHGYNIDQLSANGAGETIAIVDAYDDPYITNDLKTFNSKLGLPQLDGLGGDGTFRVVKESQFTTYNTDWAGEISLDVEWAHAIAPKANIVLVEAQTAFDSDLIQWGVNYARNLPAVSAISMSFGSPEFSSERQLDTYFTTPTGHIPITFIASSGDSGAPVSYPAISPNVLSVGGTSLVLDGSGNYIGETAWTGSGGGISSYESKPSYQTTRYSMRTNPDVAYNADPNTGVTIVDTLTPGYAWYGVPNTNQYWMQIGGTSAGAPQWAGLIALINQQRAQVKKATLSGVSQVLPAVYLFNNSGAFRDVVGGMSMGSPKYSAVAGYDLATGNGSPVADVLSDVLVLE